MAYKNLENALRNEGISQKKLAEILGVSEKSVYNKISGKSEFTVPEYRKICTILPKYSREWLFTEIKTDDNAD